ncbi:G-type lectin S-receptor-like serine/threonine-protein kinase At4g27290 isoform X1 [Ipomoea triloba]|uniref:G-type lectin S-receptor-like serine/threonine-protein kinase At4g27290 isoform X1 n=1 Tax=Ipomoea triloba TaxID=35885 RepID=UPI00125CF3C1|nr:G-type lectin S-receptor-like serine/threonine-protein kinase At4g27290 isoform X1 [Ipomoea triloba]
METLSLLLLSYLLLLAPNPQISHATDFINSSQIFSYGDAISSSGGRFELGFFSLGSSVKRYYVGIWYKQISVQTIVWVANRNAPILNTSQVVLKLIPPGRLLLVHGTDTNVNNSTILWSTNTSRPVRNPIAQLLDSGNLVVRDAADENPENYLWQSFDYPTHTYLPDVKFGKNFVTGKEVYFTAWKNDDDPSSGDVTMHCDPAGYPQTIIRNSTAVTYRTGPWNGLRWSGTPALSRNPIYTYNLEMDKEKVWVAYHLLRNSVYIHLTLSPAGVLQSETWVEQSKTWANYITVPLDVCDSYGICGPNGLCSIDISPVCACFDKFLPKYEGPWDRTHWSEGCFRRTPLNCSDGSDGFLLYSGMKLPDTRNSWFNKTMTLQECQKVCLNNCSCTAYTHLNISTNPGTGCLLWFDDLIDTRTLSQNGQDIYIRMAASELPVSNGGSKGNRRRDILIGSLLSAFGLTLLGLGLILYIRKKKRKEKGEMSTQQDFELPLFDLSTISRATDNFSLNNKIGEGGFGPVYKGVLEDGMEIAVKRLSKSSTQGLDEFKNEVSYIAKLQHRNLVKLLGCCIQGEEMMLVYEYMTNKSLDAFIFDSTKGKLLDWSIRFNIINGIARGLLYLHQDSRLRIIHRDLKASNVLLDNDMNPKISDFGLARSVGGNEVGANTSHVVGTHGYMSPEYAVDGLFSVKSDVFSFGVLVLEIISGKRNRGFSHQDHYHNLLGHAWMLYKKERSMELPDDHLAVSCDASQVERSVHIGLLCVQQCADDRPNMSSVVMMLANENLLLPEAKEPGFFTERRIATSEYSSSTQGGSSVNEVSISLLDPR